MPVVPDAGSSAEPELHRPDEEIPNRPRLKPKPVGSRQDVAAAGPVLKGGTLVDGPEPSAPGGEAPQPGPPKKVALPRVQDPAALAYGTYRSAPHKATASQNAPATAPRPDEERRVSTGFVLGIALIVVVLLGGIWLARLSTRTRSLESRIAKLEAAAPAALPRASTP